MGHVVTRVAVAQCIGIKDTDTREVEHACDCKEVGQQCIGADSCRQHGSGHLKLDETVDIREEGGRIVIEPIRPMGYDLAELLAGIAPANLHTEVDFGAPAGKEAKRKVSTAELNDVRAKIVVLVGPETQQ
jgi:antitoxin MazE